MKVSYNWLSQYVDLAGYSAEQLAEKLTRSGIEVDVVESRNKGVSQVVVGYVKSREKHPDADKLSVCKLDVGTGEELQIVCGAQNVGAGQKVPVAVVGAVLPGNFKIKRAKLRGVESQGMICSAKELGLNERLLPKEQQEGILVLPQDSEVGGDAAELLGLNDAVLELDLTPNRSDCLSMIGTAYEIAAILERKIQLPEPQVEESAARNSFSVAIEAADACQRYTARLLNNVVIAPSPLWLQNRLMAAGIRPINNVVDITNFVMQEYGQPLHAFDADRLAGEEIKVRFAQSGETITTLDGVERKLEPHMLLITDGEKPIALAGVMGGANSEVTANTTRILLESAKFDGGIVRKTSRQLGLRSESSIRFEKEVDQAAVVPALNRAAALIAQLAGGIIAQGIASSETEDTVSPQIELGVERVNRYLGTELSLADVRDIFDRLHFAYELRGDGVLVHVPSRRGDITRDVDLIEEIARLYGYDHIPTSPITGETTPGARSREQRIRLDVGRFLNGAGLHEAVLYSFTHPDRIAEYKGLYPDAMPVALSSPMSAERSVLRTSLIPHLIDTAVYNRNRNAHDIAMFEIGTVFLTEETTLSQLPNEKKLLGILMTGGRTSQHWLSKPRPVDFYDLKGTLDGLLAYLGIQGMEYRAVGFPGLHPGRTAELTMAGKRIGVIGQLHPELQRQYDLDDTYVCELEMGALYALADFRISYDPIAKYPSITRDIAVVVDRGIAVSDLLAAIQQAAGEWLTDTEVFDVYMGEKLGADKKSVAISLKYRHDERTLTDEEVNDRNQAVISKLEADFAAELRK